MSTNELIFADSAEWADEKCTHGNLHFLCEECECAKTLLAAADEINQPVLGGPRFDSEEVIDLAASKIEGRLVTWERGGALAKPVRDEDDHRDLEGKTACPSCWMFHPGECD